MSDVTTKQPVSDEKRAEILNGVIARFARDGWQISSVFAGQAIAQRKQSVTGGGWFGIVVLIVYTLLTIFTGGLFLIIVGIMYLTRKTESIVIRVDKFGVIDLD